MIDAGIVLILVGAIVQAVAPAQDAIAYRRWQSTGIDGGEPPGDPRIAEADAALARDPLIVSIAGIAGIAEIYRRG